MRPTTIMAGLSALGLALGCGGVSMDTTPAPGALTLLLGSDSLPAYKQIVLTVSKVDASRDGVSWVSLGIAPQAIDLATLHDGTVATLATAVSVPSGTYNRFRITWGTQNPDLNLGTSFLYTTANPATVRALTLPSGLATTLASSVLVPAGVTATAQIMFSGSQVIQQRASNSFTFQGAGLVYGLGNCSTIAGHLVANGAPLSGVEVYAETVDTSFQPAIQRRGLTDAQGAYQLEALPIGGLYYVVAQPAGSTSAYPALASAGMTAAAVTTYTQDFNFTGQTPLAPGALTLTVTPASTANETTWAELRQALVPGGSGLPQALIVRSQTVITGASQDQASFPGLYPGAGLYAVAAQRSDASPTLKAASGLQTVTAGATTPVSVSYP